MKKSLIILSFLCLSATIFATDIIVLKNSTKIEVQVLEVSKDGVKYKKISNLDGPTFVMEPNEIVTIIYGNGEVQNFEDEAAIPTAESNVGNRQEVYKKGSSVLYNSGNGPRFQEMMSVGANFMSTHAGPSGDFICGSRIRDYIFVGGGVGVHTLLKDKNKVKDHNLSIAFYANPRGYLPVRKNFMPFLDWHVGFQVAGFGMQDGQGTGLWTVLFFTKVGMGFEIKKFNFSVGYEYLLGVHTGYVSIGLALPSY